MTPAMTKARVPDLRIILLALTAAVAAIAAVSLAGFADTRRELTDVRLAKAAAVGGAVKHVLDRALGYGIPLDRLIGVEEYLAGIADRNPDLRFFAVTDGEGRWLYRAGIGHRRLDPLASDLETMVASEGAAEAVHGSATVRPIERAGFLILRLPLRDGAGHVLVAVQPKQVGEQLASDAARGIAFAAAILLLVHRLVRSALQAGFHRPLARLRQAMVAVAGGRFAVLLADRPRDGIGRAMLAFNAAVHGLHDHRQRVIVQADEVRSAVFDADVAAEAERTRHRCLVALGDGFSTPPARVDDPRTGDERTYTTLVLAGAVAAGVAGVAAGGLAPVVAGPVAIAVAVAAGLAGRLLATPRIPACLSAALVFLLALVVVLRGEALAGDWPVLVMIAAAGGLGAGAALRFSQSTALGVPTMAASPLWAMAQGIAIGGLASFAFDWEATALAAVAVPLAVGAFVAVQPLSVPRTR